jgi:hypothetical protein
MDIQITEWADIVGAIAVTVSLIFVGLQIRSNTISTQASTYQDAVGHEISILLAISSTRESAANQNVYLSDPGALSGQDFEQARWTFLATMRLWENLYHQWCAGTLSEGAWGAREPLVQQLILSPPAAELLDFAAFSGPFMEYVDRVRADDRRIKHDAVS